MYLHFTESQNHLTQTAFEPYIVLNMYRVVNFQLIRHNVLQVYEIVFDK